MHECNAMRLLLPERHHRPRRRAAKPRDERGPIDSMTSSARASREGGISRLSAFAVLMSFETLHDVRMESATARDSDISRTSPYVADVPISDIRSGRVPSCVGADTVPKNYSPQPCQTHSAATSMHDRGTVHILKHCTQAVELGAETGPVAGLQVLDGLIVAISASRARSDAGCSTAFRPGTRNRRNRTRPEQRR